MPEACWSAGTGGAAEEEDHGVTRKGQALVSGSNVKKREAIALVIRTMRWGEDGGRPEAAAREEVQGQG